MTNLRMEYSQLINEISILKKKIDELEQSERKHNETEEALRSSLQQLRLLIDTGPDFFFLKDLDLRYQLVSAANARFFGRTEADITGRTDFELMTAEAAGRCEETDRLAISEQRIVITIEPFQGRFYETYKFPVIVKGDIVGVAGIIRNITDRKLAEESLRDAQTRYRLLFEHAPYGVVIVDPATARCLEFNDAAHRQLGYSREEFAKLAISDFEVVETFEQTRQRIEKVIREGRDDFETRHRTKDGEIRDIHVTAQMTRLFEHTVYHCVWRDITDRKRAVENLLSLETVYQGQKLFPIPATGNLI